jgi:hypothetical protein
MGYGWESRQGGWGLLNYMFTQLVKITVFLRSILILSSNLRLGLHLPIGLFTSGFTIKIVYTFLISPMRATYHASLTLLVSIILTISGKDRNDGAPHYADVSGILSLYPSQVSRQTMRWSLRGVNILSAVRGEYRACRWIEDFLLVNAKVTQ